jgi:trk system potassium uptake protein TrkH
MILYVRASIKRTRGVNIFKRRLDDDSIKRASAVACTNLTLALVATLVICGNQSLDLRDVMLETFSAMSTVGMSTGITRELTVISQIAIMFLMYAGRVGSLSMALSFTEKKKTSPYELPEEKILIG